MSDECKGKKLFKGFVIILLLMNTFFIGSIWYTMSSCGGGLGKSAFCPLGSKGSGKICPLTGKNLSAGSGTDMKGSGSTQ